VDPPQRGPQVMGDRCSRSFHLPDGVPQLFGPLPDALLQFFVEPPIRSSVRFRSVMSLTSSMPATISPLASRSGEAAISHIPPDCLAGSALDRMGLPIGKTAGHGAVSTDCFAATIGKVAGTPHMVPAGQALVLLVLVEDPEVPVLDGQSVTEAAMIASDFARSSSAVRTACRSNPAAPAGPHHGVERRRQGPDLVTGCHRKRFPSSWPAASLRCAG